MMSLGFLYISCILSFVIEHSPLQWQERGTVCHHQHRHHSNPSLKLICSLLSFPGLWCTIILTVLLLSDYSYLHNLISYHQSGRLLRSSSQSLLHVPRIKTDFGRRAFSSAGPQIWNHIPTAIRASASLDSFKRHLKTHYLPHHGLTT